MPEPPPRLWLPHATPEQAGEFLPGMRSAGREREEGKEGLGLPGRQRQGRCAAESPLKPAKENEIETRDGLPWPTVAWPPAEGHSAFDAIFDADLYGSRTPALVHGDAWERIPCGSDQQRER